MSRPFDTTLPLSDAVGTALLMIAFLIVAADAPGLYAAYSAAARWIITSHSMAKLPHGTRVARLKGMHVEVPIVTLSRADDRSRLVSRLRSVLLAAARDQSPVLEAEQHPGDQASAPAPISLLELRQLRAFTVALDEHSLTRAAKRLGLNQSTVSRQLHALERVTGCALLERPMRDVTPTAAGRVFAAAASTALSLVEGAIAQSQRVARGIAGSCVIGTIPAELTDGLLDARLAVLAERHPDIAFEIREMFGGEQPEALFGRRIDIGIAGALRQDAGDPAVCRESLRHDPIEAAVRLASAGIPNVARSG